MEAILIHPSNKEQLEAVKAFAKALKMPFETRTEGSSYDREFVKQILLAEKDIKDGKGVKIRTEDLWK